MLKRLKVENYRSLDGVEWSPPRGVSVLIGDNGSGKSTLGQLLRQLGRFLLDGEAVAEVFSPADRSRWNPDLWSQRFEFTFEGPIGDFEYELVVGFDSHTLKPWVAEECVKLGGRTLYEFDGASGHLATSPPVSFPLTNGRSYLGIVEPQTARSTLMGFRDVLSRMLALKLEPTAITAVSAREEERLRCDGSNFAAWYRWFSSNQPQALQSFFDSLQGPIPGFRVLKTRELGAQYETVATLDIFGGSTTFPLDQLSDGQRQLLVLYLLLQRIEQGTVLFLDEPDNYLSLREIQPWLSELDRVITAKRAQVLVVTHQSEAMNYLASRHAFIFSRPGNGATRIAEFSADSGAPSDAILYSEAASK